MPDNPPSILATMPLVAMFRAAMFKQIGVRFALLIGVVAAIGFIVTMGVLANRYGPDSTTLSLLARSALVIAASCSALTGLSLARRTKDDADYGGLVALASARGFSEAESERSETLASVRVAVETVLGPIALVSLFAFAITVGRHIPGAARAILGSAAFGAVASAGTGLLAAACRRWAGARGRSWFLLVVVVPWAFAEIVPSSWGSDYLSIPALVGRAWDLLAAVESLP